MTHSHEEPSTEEMHRRALAHHAASLKRREERLAPGRARRARQKTLAELGERALQAMKEYSPSESIRNTEKGWGSEGDQIVYAIHGSARSLGLLADGEGAQS